ncbi:MAG: cobalamin-dependent protein, partial [Mycobacteriales bacterium]
MRVAVIAVYVDLQRGGRPNHGLLQPQIGPLIAALLPSGIEIDIVNDTVEDPAWDQHYDLVFISCLSPDFDRARQIAHYWRRRGAKTVFGGTFPSLYPALVAPYFDAIVVGDAEGSVDRVYADFVRGHLEPIYVSAPYDPAAVPVPRFDLVATKQLVPFSLEVTRGCPFSCNFCVLSAIGTRHHVRPVSLVMRDLRAARAMLRHLVPLHKRRVVLFMDNNIGGNLAY